MFKSLLLSADMRSLCAEVSSANFSCEEMNSYFADYILSQLASGAKTCCVTNGR